LELVKETGEREARTVELPGAAMEIYKQEEVAKFMATASAEGVPNVALIVSQVPAEPGRIVFGEFMMVKTLANLQQNSRIASFAITPKLEMAGFKGDVTGWTESGPYIDLINSIPFFRYNAYAGIHKVATAEIRELLPFPPKVSMLTAGREFVAMRTRGRVGRGERVSGVATPEPVRAKFDGIMSIKVLAFQDGDGYPNVVPLFGVMFRTPGELRFKVSGYNSVVGGLETPCTVALNVLTLDLMTYQVKGTLVRFERSFGFHTGVVRLEEVYSSMPPLCGQRLV
jgi:hypothetical protein